MPAFSSEPTLDPPSAGIRPNGALPRLPRLLYLVKTDLLRNLPLHFLLALSVLLLTPLLFGVTGLDAREAAQPLEFFVQLTGIVLLTPLFLPEQDEAVGDVVKARPTSPALIWGTRALCSTVALALCIAGFLLYMRACGSAVDLRHFASVFSSALFLGGLGALSWALLGNVACAYLLPILYYAVNLFAGKRLGVWNLFPMMMGASIPLWPRLLAGILLLTAAVWWKSRRRVFF